MPSGFWDYIHVGRSRTRNGNHDDDDDELHNLQEGLFQIASQTCNILVQVNNTNNNINLGSGFSFKDFESHRFSCSYGGESSSSSMDVDLAAKKAFFDLESSVVLLEAKPSTPTKVRFSRLSEYKRRLSVSHDQPS
jgi:hypothetical protein